MAQLHGTLHPNCDAPEYFGWLIEAAESSAAKPLYWAGSFGDERNRWTFNSRIAVRFCRKSDAESVERGVLNGYAVRVAEHCWTN